MTSVNILGADYELIVDHDEENTKLDRADGYIEYWSKKIVFAPCKHDKLTAERADQYAAKLVRHEVVHAFLHECGIEEYARDERLVGWIAHHLPKLKVACDAAELAVVDEIAPKPADKNSLIYHRDPQGDPGERCSVSFDWNIEHCDGDQWIGKVNGKAVAGGTIDAVCQRLREKGCDIPENLEKISVKK